MLADLFETNPVLAVEGLIERLQADPLRWATAGSVLDPLLGRIALSGHGLPHSRLRRWRESGLASPSTCDAASRPWLPGVLGLVHGDPGACVVPLEVRRSSEWRIASRLPLKKRRLTDLVLRLVEEASLLEPGMLPEARAFSIETSFPWPSAGTSMDVAAVLAILRSEAGDVSVLDRACAVVEPDGGKLRAVEGIQHKLEAFVRECGRGTLLVRHAECRVSASFESSFDEVWSVSTVAELAQRLLPLDVFEPWSSKAPQGLAEADLVLERLRDLQHPVPDHEAIVRLAGRALECEWDSRVPPAIRHLPRLDLLRSLRHLGRYEQALLEGERWCQEVRDLGDAASREMLAEADLEHAAALFDPADFDAMLKILDPWLGRIDDDPLAVSVGLRTRLWNTAARAMVRAPRDGWQDLFQRSLDLQKKTDPTGIARTRNYLIEGFLRHDVLDQAQAQIAVGERSKPDTTSRSMLAFYRADLERRRGNQWVSEGMEGLEPVRSCANHGLGLYLQATARQAGREPGDAGDRFWRAAACFEFDAGRVGEANVLWVLAGSMRLAKDLALGGCPVTASERLVSALSQPGLEKVSSLIGATPQDPIACERFLTRMPWL